MKIFRLRLRWILGFCLLALAGFAQRGLAVGDVVPDLPLKKRINSPSPLFPVADSGNRLTIIDFFGTWCIPCLRALPHLTRLKEVFRDELTIVLVSNETERQLTRFVNGRSPFLFPIVVDEDNRWHSAFQPPALPYTVVIKNGRVLAITEAAAITAEAIRNWKTVSATTATPAEARRPATENKRTTVNNFQQSANALVRLSQAYLYAAKTGDSLALHRQNLANLSPVELKNSLVTDSEKKAFWINLYNGYTQAALNENAGQYQRRSKFFKHKGIKVAGALFSLDDIEHGILRRSKIKWSLGYLPKLFPARREKDLRVKTLDWRLHFALNCGAKSCPPIAFYNDEDLDTQLGVATKTYLTSEAAYDSKSNTVRLPKLMSWFRADFGGKKGMITILREYGIITAGAVPTIAFKGYDWTLALNNYTTQQY